MLWKDLIGPCKDYNSININLYIKSHLELQREITLIELAHSPYFFVLSICPVYMNMFAMFDENGPPPPLKNHKNIGFLNKTGLDRL